MSVDARTLAAIWLFKNKKNLVADCLIGKVTKEACQKHIEAVRHPISHGAVYVNPPEPGVCQYCEHAKGFFFNEKSFADSEDLGTRETTDHSTHESIRMEAEKKRRQKNKRNSFLFGQKDPERNRGKKRRESLGATKKSGNVNRAV